MTEHIKLTVVDSGVGDDGKHEAQSQTMIHGRWVLGTKRKTYSWYGARLLDVSFSASLFFLA